VDGDSPAFGRSAEQRTVVPPPPLTGVAPIHATVVQTRRDWSLRHQNDEVRPFLLTLCVGSVHRDHATSGGSLRYSWLMVSSPDEAPVPSSLPTAVEAAREAFLGLGWAQGMAERHNRRRGATPSAWSLRQKFKGHIPLFLGFLAPDRS
jgi:hypothetical protein